MAENEYLDASKARRWQSVAQAIREGSSDSEVAEEDSGDYQYDFLSRDTTIPPKKRRYLSAFLNQVDCLNETDLRKLPLCIEKHLRQTHIFNGGYSVETAVDLFRRYRDEWLGLIRRAESIGCKWTKLINLPSKAA